MARLCKSTQPTQLFATGEPLSAQKPARSADWPRGPCFAPAPCFTESNYSFDLKFQDRTRARVLGRRPGGRPEGRSREPNADGKRQTGTPHEQQEGFGARRRAHEITGVGGSFVKAPNFQLKTRTRIHKYLGGSGARKRASRLGWFEGPVGACEPAVCGLWSMVCGPVAAVQPLGPGTMPRRLRALHPAPPLSKLASCSSSPTKNEVVFLLAPCAGVSSRAYGVVVCSGAGLSDITPLG